MKHESKDVRSRGQTWSKRMSSTVSRRSPIEIRSRSNERHTTSCWLSLSNASSMQTSWSRKTLKSNVITIKNKLLIFCLNKSSSSTKRDRVFCQSVINFRCRILTCRDWMSPWSAILKSTLSGPSKMQAVAAQVESKLLYRGCKTYKTCYTNTSSRRTSILWLTQLLRSETWLSSSPRRTKSSSNSRWRSKKS